MSEGRRPAVWWWLACGLVCVLALACAEGTREGEPAEADGGAVPSGGSERSGVEPAGGPAHDVTFYRDVAPILLQHCATCHRPVEKAEARPAFAADDPLCIAGAPFSLLDSAPARRHASAIVEATATRAMPPWLPEPGHGRFLNERRLRDDEIATIRRWVEQGTPEGDPADAPPIPEWAPGWQLGEPDLVLTLPEPFVLEAGSHDVFRNFVIPSPAPSRRYVRAIEFRAGNPRVLHHANIGVDPTRSARRLDRADAGPGFALMPGDLVRNVYGWSPGKVPVMEPAETAWTLEAGTDIVVQLHMVGGSQREEVQPAIGLFFSDTPPTRTPIVVKLESKTIDIPAGESEYVVEDTYVLPVDVDAVSVYPHAHARAREIRGTATRPDGTTESLIWIRKWDVRWQDQYRYAEPVFLPRGTTVAMRFTYDNSAGNPNNPQLPPVRVRWGQNSTDEMGALWLEVVPRRAEDARILADDFFRRALRTETARAEMLVRIDPRDPAARNLLALQYVQAGRLDEAAAHLQEALRLAPDHAEAHSNLGSVLQRQGRLAEALTHLREAVRRAPRDDRVHFNLGNALFAAGQADEALREWRAAIALNPDNADAHFNLAMVLGPRNQLDEAVNLLRRVLELNPQRADAHRNLGVALGLQGRLDEAIRHVRTALALEPGSAEAQNDLRRLLAAKGAGG